MAVIIIGILCFAVVFQFCYVSARILDISPENTSQIHPSLPDKFTLRTEMVIQRMQHRILYIQETYDKDLQRLSLRVDGQGQRSRAILDIQDGILFNLNSDNGLIRCQSVQCNSSRCYVELQTLLPEAAQFDNPQIVGSFWANELLGYDPNKSAVYMGQYMWQGIEVDRWDTNNSDSSKNISTYWTVEDWQTSLSTRVPIAVEVTFKADTIRLTISHYSPNVTDDEELQMPDGVHCNRWPSEIPFPLKNNNANAIEFRTEMLLKHKQEFSWVKAWYSFSDGLYRIDYHTAEENKNAFYAISVIDTEHDKYFMIINNEQPDYCYTGNVSQYSIPHVAFLPFGPNMTFPRSVTEFFGNESFVYNGKNYKDNLEIHSWQSFIKDGIKGITVDTLWEWEFVYSKILEDPEPLPLRKIITVMNSKYPSVPGFEQGAQTIHRFHDFLVVEPLEIDPLIFDVLSCHDKWLHLEFRFKGVEKLPANDPVLYSNTFLNLWRKEIAKQLLKSILYITHLELQADSLKNQYYLRFKLLDDILDNPDEPEHNMSSLLETEKKIKNLIDAEKLSISWVDKAITKVYASAIAGSLRRVESCPDTQTSKLPIPTTYIDIITTTKSPAPTHTAYSRINLPSSKPRVQDDPTSGKRYSAGTASAISIGFLVVGFSITASATYIIRKKNPSLFKNRQGDSSEM